MKHFYLPFLIILVILTGFYSCSDDDSYTVIPESPVVVDLSAVPYATLSEYHFFEGTLKELKPALNVLPYQPASALFSDYAHKKRFVWMPPNTKATFDGNGNSLQLPIGAVLIKNFYYENVQNNSAGTTILVETRLMIRKESGWIFANYVWNDTQTEAFFDLNGSFKDITWSENGVTKSVNYRIPNEVQCITCHKTKEIINGSLVDVYTPIGIKPQNLNFNLNYGNSEKNQLEKWIEMGYLGANFSLPTALNTTIDYSDSSQPLELRVRSYLDINCAHCHQNDRHCDYRAMRFAFNETFQNQTNIGVCMTTADIQDFPQNLNQIINPGNAAQSMLYYRLNTTNEAIRMPLHGRSLIHEEGIAMIEEWINSLRECN